MKEFINTFLDYLSVERGLANNTISSYRDDLKAYFDFISGKAINTLSQTTKSNITDFMLFQKNKGIGANSIARRLAAIKSFYRFCVRERILNSDPTSLVETPKLWKRIPESLSVGEVESLLNQPDTRNIQGIRDRAILETLYA
ncbi:MAG: site-specific integrase, partial [Candidatus Omnitrophica bacterium]|nr:site-specific integrase [Candidatus Omnitrophota bacterium]